MEHGKYVETILKQCKYEGRDPSTVKFLREAPTLLPGLDLYYNAFWELTSCRQIGMGVGPIPWTAVEAYGHSNGFDEPVTLVTEDGVEVNDLMDDLHYFITMMDSAYMKWSAKKSESK